jgi:Ca2+/Na+ antiporter
MLYCGLIAGIAALIPLTFPGPDLLAPKFWVIFFFLSGLTYIAYLTAYLGIKRNPEVGVMAIMGSITLKMLFSLAFVLIYSQNRPQMGLKFLVSFFSLYLLFSFFEIYCLLRNLRHQNK